MAFLRMRVVSGMGAADSSSGPSRLLRSSICWRLFRDKPRSQLSWSSLTAVGPFPWSTVVRGDIPTAACRRPFGPLLSRSSIDVELTKTSGVMLMLPKTLCGHQPIRKGRCPGQEGPRPRGPTNQSNHRYQLTNGGWSCVERLLTDSKCKLAQLETCCSQQVRDGMIYLIRGSSDGQGLDGLCRRCMMARPRRRGRWRRLKKKRRRAEPRSGARLKRYA